jgi:hypothetical protein
MSVFGEVREPVKWAVRENEEGVLTRFVIGHLLPRRPAPAKSDQI